MSTRLFKLVKLNKTKPSQLESIFNDNPNIDINVKNAWGETLIYNCCKHAVNIVLLDWLYNAGCDPNIINKKKFNAFNACLEWNHKKNSERVLDWLIQKNCVIAKYYPNLPLAHNMIICHGTANTLPWISKHFSLNEQDINGNTPLHISVHQDTIHNSPAPCEWLCKCPLVDVNIQNNLGQTPLHLACQSGFSNCIEMLLNAKCNKDLLDMNQKTALDVLLTSKDSTESRKWTGHFKESIEIMTK